MPKVTKRTQTVEPPVEPVPEAAEMVTVTVAVPTKTAAEIEAAEEARWEQSQAMRKAGTLQAVLVKAVRTHAAAKVADEDTRWLAVTAMSDAAIWAVVQYCDYERGAIGQMARALNKRPVV